MAIYTDRPDAVSIVEVGPRDGLQNETAILSPAAKIELVNRLSSAGLTYIEAGSFVSPRWVPQMADSSKVFDQIKRHTGTTYAALTPNLKGYLAARSAGADEVAVFTSPSETFCQKNLGCSLKESLERFREIFTAARSDNIPVRGYTSCLIACPYEGTTPLKSVAQVIESLLELGCYQVSLGDTIGVGSAGDFEQRLPPLIKQFGAHRLAIHCHDTYGQALANIYVALNHGICTIDSAIAGLGGCPYARGASGNVATEDVVYLLESLGIHTGINLEKLIAAGHFICGQLERNNGSRVALARLGSQG